MLMPEFITLFFTSDEYKPWVVGLAGTGAVVTISLIVKMLTGISRKK